MNAVDVLMFCTQQKKLYVLQLLGRFEPTTARDSCAGPQTTSLKFLSLSSTNCWELW